MLSAWRYVGDAVAIVVASPKMSLISLRVVPGFFEYGMFDLDRFSKFV